MTFEDLKKEYNKVLIGKEIHRIIVAVCTLHMKKDRSILRFWQEDSLTSRADDVWDEDLVNGIISSFIAEKLIDNASKGLKYLFFEATSVESFEKLLRQNFSWYVKDHLRSSGIGNVIARLNAIVRNGDFGSRIMIVRKGLVLTEYLLALRLSENHDVFKGSLNELAQFSDPSKYHLAMGATNSNKRPVLVHSKDMIGWMEELLRGVGCPVCYGDIRELFIRDFQLTNDCTSIYDEKSSEEPDSRAKSDVCELMKIWKTLSSHEKAILATFEDLDAAMKLLNRGKSFVYEQRKKILSNLVEDIYGSQEEIAAQITALIQYAYVLKEKQVSGPAEEGGK